MLDGRDAGQIGSQSLHTQYVALRYVQTFPLRSLCDQSWSVAALLSAIKFESIQQFLDSNFFGLESFDVNLGRDVVLDVAPVRDDQVSGPISSRTQSVSDEHSWKHFCTRLMKTTFGFRGGWIEPNATNEVPVLLFIR